MEAKQFDIYAVDVDKKQGQEKVLVGHVPIEFSFQFYKFIPVPTFYLKRYDDFSSHAVKRRSPAKRSAPLAKKSSALCSSNDLNDSAIIDFELSSVDIDVDVTSTPHCQSSASAAAEHDFLSVASRSTYSLSEVIPVKPISLVQQPTCLL